MDDGCLPEIRNANVLERIEATYQEILWACLGIIAMTLWRNFYSTYLIAPYAREYARRKSRKFRVTRPAWLSSTSTATSNKILKKWKEIVLFSRSRKPQKNGLTKNKHSRIEEKLLSSDAPPNGKVMDGYSERDLDALIKKLDLDKDDIAHALRYLEYKRKYADLKMKYGEQLWKVLTQGAMMLYGTYFLIVKAPFFWDTRLFWTEFPQIMSFEARVLYHGQLAYHGHRALYQVYEHVKPDWLAYVIHHWVTMLLILLSWSIGFSKLGAVVMVLHDYSDVFLAIAKFAKYVGYRQISKYSFYCFMVGWFWCRMYLLGKKIIYSIAYESIPKFGCREPYRYAFLFLLIALFFLHMYWGYLILLVAWRRVVTGSVDDVRSGVSDDDEDGDDAFEDEDALSESDVRLDNWLW